MSGCAPGSRGTERRVRALALDLPASASHREQRAGAKRPGAACAIARSYAIQVEELLPRPVTRAVEHADVHAFHVGTEQAEHHRARQVGDVDPPLKRFASLFRRRDRGTAPVDRRIPQKAWRGSGPVVLQQRDWPRDCGPPAVARALHRLLADRLREHVVADSAQVQAGERLDVDDRGVLAPCAVGPNAEIGEALRPLGALEPLQAPGRDALRIADRQDPGIALAQREPVDVRVPRFAGNIVGGGEQARRAP